MKFMQRLLLMLAVLTMGLAVVATRSTAQEPGAPWASDCMECGPVTFGDPDGGSAGSGRNSESYSNRRLVPRSESAPEFWTRLARQFRLAFGLDRGPR